MRHYCVELECNGRRAVVYWSGTSLRELKRICCDGATKLRAPGLLTVLALSSAGSSFTALLFVIRLLRIAMCFLR